MRPVIVHRRRSRSSSEAGWAAPRPNRRSTRSTARSTSDHRSPRSSASCSAPDETRPVAATPSSLIRRCSPGNARYSSLTTRYRSAPTSVASGSVRERVSVVKRGQTSLHRHRPGPVTIGAHPGRDPARERQQLAQDLLLVVQVVLEGLLVADRLRGLVGTTSRSSTPWASWNRCLAFCSPSSRARIGLGVRPDHRSCGPRDAPASHRSSPHAPKPADRQRLQESLHRPSLGPRSRPSGLQQVRRDLGHELGGGDAGPKRWAPARARPGSDAARRRWGVTEEA